jgi:hypothetical protein
MIEFIGSLYILLQQFTNRYLRLDTLNSWLPTLLLFRVRFRSFFTTGGLPPISSSWRQAPWDSRPVISFPNRKLAVTVLIQPPLWLEDGFVVFNCCCSLQRSHSQVRVPRDSWPYLTVTHSRFPQPGGPGPHVYIPPRTGWPGYTPRQCVPFFTSYDLQGYGGGIRPRLHASCSVNYSGLLVIQHRGGLHRKHMHCLTMDVYYCRVLLYVLLSNGLITKNLSLREGFYRAVWLAMGLYVTTVNCVRT